MDNVLGKILIDNREKCYGGYPNKISFSQQFTLGSDFSVDFFSESGDFAISEEDMTTEKEMYISIPSSSNPVKYKKIGGFPVSHEINNISGFKVLRVKFLDMSKKYLDKHIVLLYAKHAYQDSERVITVGKVYDYEDGARTAITEIDAVSSEDKWIAGKAAIVKYTFTELRDKMLAAGIPMSEKMRGFKLQDGITTSAETQLNHLYDFSGTLRDVLTAWSEELGVLFYWNTLNKKNDGIGELDILQFGAENNKVWKLKYDRALKNLKSECEVIEAAETCSIEDTYANLSILGANSDPAGSAKENVSFSMYPLNFMDRPKNGRASSKFLRDVSGSFPSLEIRIRDKNGRGTYAPTQDEIDFQELAMAAFRGPDFFRYYILIQCLLYGQTEWALTPFSIESLATGENVADDTSITDLSLLTTFPDIAIKRNNLAARLYKFGTGYTNTISVTLVFCRKLALADSFIGGTINPSEYAKLQKSILFKHLVGMMSEQKEFLRSIKKTKTGALMMGVTANSEYLNFLDGQSIEKDYVYNGFKTYLEVAGRIFFSSNLITQKMLNLISFSDIVEWEYAGLGIADSNLSFLWESNGQDKPQAQPSKWRINLKRGEAADFWSKYPEIEKYESIRIKAGNQKFQGYDDMDSISKVLQDKLESIKSSDFGASGEFGISLPSKFKAPSDSKSCSTEGYQQIQSIRSAQEKEDGEEELKQYPRDRDWGVFYKVEQTLESLHYNSYSNKANYELTEISDKSSGGDNSDENIELIVYSEYNIEDFLNSLKDKNSIKYPYFDERPETMTGTKDKDAPNGFSYGLITMPNLKDPKISNVRIIDESWDQRDLLELMPYLEIVSSKTSSAKKLEVIKKAIARVSRAYAEMKMSYPSYSATLTFKGIPDIDKIPTVEEGLEGWTLSINDGGADFVLNMGNKKRVEDKLENYLRVQISGENAKIARRIGTKVSRFNTEYKVQNRL